MTSPAGSTLSSPAWVAPARPRMERPTPVVRSVGRAPELRVGRGGVAGPWLLAAAWIALWAFFLVGVVQPVAALHAAAPGPAAAPAEAAVGR
jgi:hypothetical protein